MGQQNQEQDNNQESILSKTEQAAIDKKSVLPSKKDFVVDDIEEELTLSQEEQGEVVIDKDSELETELKKADDEDEDFDPYAIYEQDESGRFIVPLDHPIKRKNQTFTEVKIRPPFGADLRIAGNAKNDTDNGLILLERCGQGLTKDIVNRMRGSDINKCSQVLNFLSKE